MGSMTRQALYARPSVRELVKADRVVCTLADDRGDMPLHAALAHGQTADVIKCLVNAFPAACAHASVRRFLLWAYTPLAFTMLTPNSPGLYRAYTTRACTILSA